MACFTRTGKYVAGVALLALAGAARADDWPQWRGANRDGVWLEKGILEAFPSGGLKVRWRAAVGWGFCTPVVVRGRVYVTDSELVRPKARERVHAFDETTGRPIWTYAYDVSYPDWAYDEKNPLGPRATPICRDGRLYTVGIFGGLACLDAVKGDVIWKKDLLVENGGQRLECTASPLIDGELLIVFVGAKPQACVMAFDKSTGKKVWGALDESPTFSSPIVVGAGKTRQLIVWTQESVTSLNPANGKTYWRERLNTSGDFVVSTPVVRNDLLLVGGLMMKLDAARAAESVLWPRSRAVANRILSNTSTALIQGDFVYSARSTGELVCLELMTGKQVWQADKVTTLGRGASIHLTPNGDSVLLFNDRGELIRARVASGGYQEMSRVSLLEPTFPFFGRKYAWVPPSYANGHVFARNDKVLVCARLTKGP